jgi:hypothetical protein
LRLRAHCSTLSPTGSSTGNIIAAFGVRYPCFSFAASPGMFLRPRLMKRLVFLSLREYR